jgi:hypothetical protein
MSRFIRCLTLFGVVTTACMLTAASAQAIHPRPKGASPMRMSLVPAYTACAAPNRTHGPPLAFASCNPPVQTSAQATVGTPDAFGGAANSTSHLRFWHILTCTSNCPGDSDDIGLEVALNDVRCVPTGARCGTANASGPADYSGEVRFSFAFHLTDHWNGTSPGGGTDAATAQGFYFDQVVVAAGNTLAWPCAPSGSTSTGSSCNLHTSLLALFPGSVKSDKRTVWVLDELRIFDGGADGDGDSTWDNAVFMRPGIFIP